MRNMGVSALAHSLLRASGLAHTHISFFVGALTPKQQKVKLADREIGVDIVNHRM